MTAAKIPLIDLSLPFGCGMSCSKPCSDETASADANNNQTLANEGWIARSTIDEPRLSELAQTYKAIGYEVKIIYSNTPSLSDDCTICFDELTASNKDWGTVYVRKNDNPR